MSLETVIDGSTRQGTTTKERFIELTYEMHKDYKNNEDFVYMVFKPKALGTLYATREDETRQIVYEPEEIDIEPEGVVRDIVVSLRCADPLFEAIALNS